MALFLGIGKRRAELALLADEANTHRKVLEGYTLPLLDQFMTIVSSGAIITYSLYTFWAPGLPENHIMMLTIPFVIFGVFRYLHLVQVEQCGGAPEDVLFSDRPLQIDLAAWGVSVVLIFYLSVTPPYDLHLLRPWQDHPVRRARRRLRAPGGGRAGDPGAARGLRDRRPKQPRRIRCSSRRRTSAACHPGGAACRSPAESCHPRAPPRR